MRFLCGVLLVLAVPSCVVAQQTEADLKARLVKAPLYLRGQWGTDKLDFDAAGKLKGTSHAVSFTLSGIEVDSVKLTSKKLVLGGQRVGLEFNTLLPRRVGLVVRGLANDDPERMTIEIARPADGDFLASLDAIFAEDLADLVPQMPDYWQGFAQKHLLPADRQARASAAGAVPADGPRQPAGPAKLEKIGGSIRAPQLLSKVDPEYDNSARALKYSGIVLVNLVVDSTGTPRLVRILRPIGLGLDERAVYSVAQYTFKPALDDGKPVAVKLNVEVNFQIF